MKIILTGSSGFIGREVLEQCLQNTSITSIVALSRRDLPSAFTDNPKLKVTIVKDFTSYSESVLQDFKDAEGCIWSLGKARMPDSETAKKVSIDYTLAAAKAFAQASTQHSTLPGREPKKFRFVYVSGAATEQDQTKPLWFMQDYRRIRGQVETELLDFAKEHQDIFESYIMRPAMVLSKETNLRSLVFGLGPSVRVNVLGKAMIGIALNGNEDRIVENSTINQLGT